MVWSKHGLMMFFASLDFKNKQGHKKYDTEVERFD